MKYTVEKECGLFDFLLSSLKDKSRTTVKSYLTHRQVSVNSCITTQYDTKLIPGDVVAITREKGKPQFRHPMMRILFEDEHFIVIDKKNGLLSIASDKEPTKNAFYILSEYLKNQDARNRIFVVHRLDRETSGLMMFAKSQQMQETIQKGWKEFVKDRRYAAVIEGALPDSSGEISSYLTEDRNRKVWATTKMGEGRPAVTYYKTLMQGRGYSLVDLKLDTGKKNQIRAHMEFMKAPIAGDKKYGAQTNPAGRVCLHAYRLCFSHPATGELLDFNTKIPAVFEGIVRKSG